MANDTTPAATVKLGPDGEPEPVGNEAQRLAGAKVAATFNKTVANNLKAKIEHANQAQPAEQKKIHELEHQLQELRSNNQLSPEDMATALGQTPVNQEQPNAIDAQNFQVQGQGQSESPQQ